ncbi:MAG TPA: hypothetical protein VHQ22_10820 [Terriglobales bacterium]|jgi:hypothetical protein|nr:hypothetical protein [Terriglobales bacterium]
MSRCLGRGLNLYSVTLLIVLLLVISCLAQQPAQSTPEQAAPSSQQKAEPKPSNPEADQSDESESDKPSTDKSNPQPETKITPEQAEQLFHDVDTILDFASNDTSLPKKHDVKRRLASREEVVSYLQKNMAEDKDVQRLRRTELVLKKFGLLPKDFDLQTFLVSLLEEQVAGYYDAKTKTVNLLDWVAPDLQRPVLAHELTHALQDQSFNLDKWLKKGSEDLDTKRDLKADDITKDENSEARQAVTEGQAMVVLIDYMLAPMHRTVANSPEVVQMMNDSMANGSADSKIYQNAPIFMKEALTFPYRYGVEFEAEVLRQQGKEKAFKATFENPPQTSREIMEPQTYITGEHLAPLPLPDFRHILKAYDRFDIGAIGEFDVAVLAEQYAGLETSKRIYPNWRGGYYYSVHPKGNPGAPLQLVFVSKWATPKAADQFAAIYARGMQQRYKKVSAAADSSLPADLKELRTLGGDHTWNTEEGAVVIDVKGDTILVTESLDPALTQQFREAVLGSATEKQR